MSVLSSILWFILAIGVLVTVHEFGHFWVARRVGVKVLRFSVGFGRSLWSRRAGADQTEYVIAAIPLGGYVKMLDENEGEVAVTSFLDGKIRFTDIAGVLESALDGQPGGEPESLDEVLAIDAAARRRAFEQVARLAA